MSDTSDTPKIEVGSILVTLWGYEQTNREFYEVVRRTATTATVREIKDITLYNERGMTGEKMPVPGAFKGAEIRRKIKNYGRGEYIAITDYIDADLWNGKPAHYSTYA